MLKVNQLTKKIHGKEVLKKLNFEIAKGQIAIFLGGSGAGKSTLLRILNNLESYDEGHFSLDGASLNLSSVNRSHTVGMVFQHFNLFENFNVEDNIINTLVHCKGLRRHDAHTIATELLKRYGLEDKAKATVSKLSGGQKQRLAIARTLALDPRMVCLDEPTSALDPKLTNQVAKYISELALENRIIILTTHDMNLLHQLDAHLYLMEGGTIVENALKNECLANPTHYPKLQSFLKGC